MADVSKMGGLAELRRQIAVRYRAEIFAAVQKRADNASTSVSDMADRLTEIGLAPRADQVEKILALCEAHPELTPGDIIRDALDFALAGEEARDV
jgi:hypothetical protein